MSELIIQIPRGGPLERLLTSEAGRELLLDYEVVLDVAATDAQGALEAARAGEVVLSVPSPETLVRERDKVHRVISQAGTGVEPLVIVVEAADELRADQLATVREAAALASRAVILRVVRAA